MLGPIALSVIALMIAILVVFYLRMRRAGRSWHLLSDLSPVSSQWLADYRRSR
jgi:hypothetical protein